MKFVRFSSNDGNYSLEGEVLSEKHQWSVPLSLNNQAVGLHSLHLILDTSEFKSTIQLPNFLVVKSNLVEKSIINQTGILKLVPGHFQPKLDSYYYNYEAVHPGLFVYFKTNI